MAPIESSPPSSVKARPFPGAGRLPPSGASEPVQIILDQGNNQFPQLRLPDSNGGLSVLHAGSVFSFTGKKKHMTVCQAGADCVLFVDARGMWDVVPVAASR